MDKTDARAALQVESPGLLTTVQDQGRYGYARFGVPSSGALDDGALRWANLLVGNTPEAAALEIAFLGPTLTYHGERPLIAALTGADLGATLNGAPIVPWRSFRWEPGDRLTLGGCRVGARAYLAVAGGIATPPALGSRSTDLLGQLGGHEGRALRAGDRLPLDPPEGLPPLLTLPRELIPTYAVGYVVRVIVGPQEDRVTPTTLNAFFAEPYTIGHASDRMGARLDGPTLTFRTGGPGADILSEGIATGAVQVPANGQPIVLLAGHQTTGGYAKIATVIAADLWQFGQARPGDTIRFREVTPAEARGALEHYHETITADRLLPITTGTRSMRDQTTVENRHTLAAELTTSTDEKGWTADAVAELLRRAAEAGVTALDLETSTVRLHLRRGAASDKAPAVPMTDDALTPATPVADTAPDAPQDVIAAPVLGIFYRAAKPDQPPLVEVGARVAAGQTVGLIEVMKTFHEVTAEWSAEIVAALVENGAAVQYGQPLFAIEQVVATEQSDTGGDNAP
jgi:antagonist of KipI